MLLPHDIDISARSRRFYDGTYTLKGDGFVNELGVHRDFDCRDPAARAPTPLPPLSLEDAAEHEHERNMKAKEETPASDRRSSPAWPSSSTESTTKSLGGDKLSGSPASTNGTVITVLRNDSDNTNKNPRPTCSPLQEPARSSPSKLKTPKKTDKPGPSESPLSDCTSDLSDWEESKVVMSTKKAESVREKFGKVETATPQQTTRGVAQKVVRKTRKKTTRTREPAPALALVPALLSMEQHEGSSRRRSVRQYMRGDK